MLQTHNDSRHPFELFMLSACTFAGFTQMATGARPGSVASQLDPTFQFAWSALLGVGSLVALIGVLLIKSLWIALEMESIGLLASAGSLITYAVAVVITAGVSGVAAWAITLMFALACLARRRQIERVLRPKCPKRRRWYQWRRQKT